MKTGLFAPCEKVQHSNGSHDGIDSRDLCRKFLRHLIRLWPCNVDCRNYQALPFHGKPDEMNVGQIRGAATLQSNRSPL